MELWSALQLLLVGLVVTVEATDLKNPQGLGDYLSEDKNWDSKWSIKQKIVIYGGCLLLGWVLKHKVLPMVKNLLAKKGN
jgi:hypothetical protein